MAEELVPIQENDYNELLLQTVAVLEHACIKVARFVTVTASDSYRVIGKLLHEKNLVFVVLNECSFMNSGKQQVAYDYQVVKTFLETLYVSNRLQLPLKGILLIGY